MRLDDYKKLVIDNESVCHWDGASLVKSPMDFYDHDSGWTVDGFKRKQWLSVKCPKWSLWKLGVPRE